jgi:uncharacterized protein (TIGR02145 family)
MYKELKKKLLLLFVCGAIGSVSGQAVLKVGSNPYIIDTKAVLDIESTTKGLLPPRMTKAQRDAIVSPPAGLLVWCTDSNIATEPVSGELCVYLGSGWAPFVSLAGSRLTTGKKSEANAPTRLSATSAGIKGVLVSNSGAVPTETGIVWREIIGADFTSLPLLDGTGAATVPTYKTPGALVTAYGAAIAVNIPTLTSTSSSVSPYYFRTYAKTALGIGYGNPVIFNCAPPRISSPVVTAGTTLLPSFAGTLTVNAGTPKKTVTEYGYCSGATANVTTANNKVVLSTTTTLGDLEKKLDSETFTANPTVDLAVKDYNITATATTYFRYYVIANGVTTYSSEVTFTPVYVVPTFNTPAVTAGSTSLPTFEGKMIVSAGTVNGTVTEYGYCSAATASPTTANNKVVLSTTTSLATLNTELDKPGDENSSVDLAVSDYNVAAFGTTYFRYYFIAKGVTTYSPELTFAPTIPEISTPVVTAGTTLLPTFAGTLTVKAGTPKGVVTEYGYCSGSTASPTTANNKVVLSTTSLATLETSLGATGSATDTTVDLAVTDYNVAATATTYFRYYFIAKGVTTYSAEVSFTPVYAVPAFNTPVVTNGTTLLPTFAGEMTVTKGTPKNSITEYGYCRAATASPTTANNKVVLSTPTSLATINTALGTFEIADTKQDLAVSNYNVDALGATYFRYYVIANGVTTYSPELTFAPVADAVTGGTAIATLVSTDPISAALKIGVASTSTIKVNFNVTKAGTYDSFVPAAPTGATTQLKFDTQPTGNFALGPQSLTFSISGTPATSLEGNLSEVPRIGNFSTGAITVSDATSAGIATCDPFHDPSTVVPITSTTGKTWMDRNLGASRAGTSSTDYQAYGCLYQWGRGNDGHASMTWTSSTAGTAVNSTTTTLAAADSPVNALFIVNGTSPYDWRTTKNDALWQGVSGTNNPCPSGYRVPTNAELTAECTKYNITNSATAYASIFKFVVPGSRDRSTGVLGSAGTGGYYWSSTVSGTNASVRSFNSSSAYSGASYRTDGLSVRCLKD